MPERDRPNVFAGPGAGPVDPAVRDAMIGAVADRVVTMGMSVPAIFFLESSKPLSYVGSQVMVFFGPFVQSLFAFHHYYDFATLMEDRQNVERLLVAIEQREEVRQAAEHEAKAKRKAERAAKKAGMAPDARYRGDAGSSGLLGRLRRRLFPVIVTLAAAFTLAPGSTRAEDVPPAPGTEAPASMAPAPSATLPAAPTAFRAEDTPNDPGRSITLHWTRSADDGAGLGSIQQYKVYRATSPDGPWESVGTANAGGESRETSYTDATAQNGRDYWYRVAAFDGTSESHVTTDQAVRASGQWFNRTRVNMLVAVLLLCGGVLFHLWRAQSGAKVYLRPVAGLKAFEDGVGRATEMGKKVLFVPGINDLDQVETVAGVIILGHVARMTASYETPLEVPVSRSLVMATAREVTQQAYLAAGRPDLYDPEMVHYITDEQFAYAAAVNGIMLRERPGTVFYQGKFFAESLILAETGNSIGAIQIAGTASPAQLPFFVTACDYTLIGEELFAASAYLSKDPKLIGSIKGQDFGKILFMAAIVIGILLATLTAMGVGNLSITRFFEVN